MAFFDRRNIKPAPYNKIKLQEFGNDNPYANKFGTDGSEQYAVNKGAVLCFLCDYEFIDKETVSKRLISFKGFIENLQVSLKVDYEDLESFFLPVTIKMMADYALSYSLSFDVVAHSVNEAVSNMARFSELDRILHYPSGDKGTINEGGSDKYNASPESYVFLSNLIGNGALAVDNGYTNISINNSFVRKYGLRIHVPDLKMEPDLEMGTFEFNNQHYFKSFKISMTLPISNTPFHYSQQLERTKKKKFKTLLPLVKKQGGTNGSNYTYYGFKTKKENGGYPENLFDARGFPFSIPYNFALLGQNYGNNLGYYPQNKRAKIGICLNKSDISRRNNPKILKNYVTFDAFVESFSFERKQPVSISQPLGDLGEEKYTFGANSAIIYDLSFNAVASSVNEAKANCMKLTTLFRIAGMGQKGETPKGQMKVLFSNLIKNPKRQRSNGNYDFGDIYDNGLDCFTNGMDVSIDQEMGYFEESGYFIPKAYNISMQLVFIDGNVGKIIETELEGFEGPEDFLNNQESDSVYWPFGIKYSDAE